MTKINIYTIYVTIKNPVYCSNMIYIYIYFFLIYIYINLHSIHIYEICSQGTNISHLGKRKIKRAINGFPLLKPRGRLRSLQIYQK